jgi:hypothetical protein
MSEITYLEQTCIACPEQYNIFDNDYHYLGYIRLRHGRLTFVDTQNNNQFTKLFYRDPYKGSFNTEAEKYRYLFYILDEITNEN